MEHGGNVRIDLANHAGAQRTPSRRIGRGANRHAARFDDHARGLTRAAQGNVAWRMTVRLPTVDLPAQIGPCSFEAFGAKWFAVRCPDELTSLMRQPAVSGSQAPRRWLIERRSLGALVRQMRQVTDTLFRQGGVSLDRGSNHVMAQRGGDLVCRPLGQGKPSSCRTRGRGFDLGSYHYFGRKRFDLALLGFPNRLRSDS